MDLVDLVAAVLAEMACRSSAYRRISCFDLYGSSGSGYRRSSNEPGRRGLAIVHLATVVRIGNLLSVDMVAGGLAVGLTVDLPVVLSTIDLFSVSH